MYVCNRKIYRALTFRDVKVGVVGKVSKLIPAHWGRLWKQANYANYLIISLHVFVHLAAYVFKGYIWKVSCTFSLMLKWKAGAGQLPPWVLAPARKCIKESPVCTCWLRKAKKSYKEQHPYLFRVLKQSHFLQPCIHELDHWLVKKSIIRGVIDVITWVIFRIWRCLFQSHNSTRISKSLNKFKMCHLRLRHRPRIVNRSRTALLEKEFCKDKLQIIITNYYIISDDRFWWNFGV